MNPKPTTTLILTDGTVTKTVSFSIPIDGIPLELFDFLKVLEQAAESGKYPMNNWLKSDGHSTTEKTMHDKMFHHLARSFADPHGTDTDSKLPHELQLQCRAGMVHVRRTLDIIHPDDAHCQAIDFGDYKTVCGIPNCTQCRREANE